MQSIYCVLFVFHPLLLVIHLICARVLLVLVLNFNGLLQGDLQHVGGQLRQNVPSHAQVVDFQKLQRGLKAVQLHLETKT